MTRNSLYKRCSALWCALMFSLWCAAQDILPHRLNADGGAAVPQATDTNSALPPLRCLTFETASSMPSSFRNRKENVVANTAALRPALDIVLRGERPLRVLHLGDSHVAGKAFPNAVEQTLRTAFRKAEVMPDEGTDGLVFTAIGSNGATSERFLSDSYRERIAATQADLVIVSLGTNEAHGMGYMESTHEQQLSVFLDMLRSVLPEATFLFTTPPGDYLKQVYVNYRSTGRGGKRRRVHGPTLVMQAQPVDLIVIGARPQANIAKLPQADAAAHKVLVGVQDQIQQMLVRRHGEKTVDLDEM